MLTCFFSAARCLLHPNCCKSHGSSENWHSFSKNKTRKPSGSTVVLGGVCRTSFCFFWTVAFFTKSKSFSTAASAMATKVSSQIIPFVGMVTADRKRWELKIDPETPETWKLFDIICFYLILVFFFKYVSSSIIFFIILYVLLLSFMFSYFLSFCNVSDGLPCSWRPCTQNWLKLVNS